MTRTSAASFGQFAKSWNISGVAASRKDRTSAVPSRCVNASVKTIVRLTGANERTVRNWLEGKNGPGGDNLIALIRHSDSMLRMVLTLSDRRDHLVASDLRSVHTQMRTLVQILDDLHHD